MTNTNQTERGCHIISTHRSIHHQQVPSCRVRVLGGEWAGQEFARVHVQDELCALPAVAIRQKGGESDGRRRLRNSHSGQAPHGPVPKQDKVNHGDGDVRGLFYVRAPSNLSKNDLHFYKHW